MFLIKYFGFIKYFQLPKMISIEFKFMKIIPVNIYNNIKTLYGKFDIIEVLKIYDIEMIYIRQKFA